MKSIRRAIPIILAMLLVPALSYAAGGGGATDLVVVADTRIIESGIIKYLADLYNTNITLFAIWCVVLTALYGSFLGFFMDFLMSKTGLDLTSRKIVEH
jgi:hypothetical protein